ncbi:MAG: MFS transporter [Hyphomonadaceae bacterium JAD_PAG50586_4]|nr:MAG: MFS transporter [Hyphomonadaceae bacterium JAD_PAG50586_4]
MQISGAVWRARSRQVLVLAGATLAWGGGVAMFVLLGGLFVHPLEAAFGWRRGDIALSSAILLGMGLMAPLIGVAADRVAARVFVAVGALGFAGAYVALASLDGDIRLYFAVLGFVALIAAPATSPLIYSRVVVAHFDKRRGFALSICLSGSTALAAFMLPLTQYVIETFGWRVAYLMLAGAALAIGAAAFALLGAGAPRTRDRPAQSSRAWHAVLGALGDLRFWLLALCFSAGGTALFGVAAHTQPFLTETGFDPARAAWVGALLGVVTIVARLGVGFLLDRVEPGWLGLAAFLAPVGAALSWLGRPRLGLPSSWRCR